MNYQKIVTLYENAQHAEAASHNLESAGIGAGEISTITTKTLSLSMTILEIFSSGTVALYTFTRKDPNDRKYIRDFTSLVDVEKWLKGEVIRDYAEQVEG